MSRSRWLIVMVHPVLFTHNDIIVMVNRNSNSTSSWSGVERKITGIKERIKKEA
jgi:hypothetical protein